MVRRVIPSIVCIQLFYKTLGQYTHPKMVQKYPAPSWPPILLDQVRDALRVKHYSIRIEGNKSLLYWLATFDGQLPARQQALQRGRVRQISLP